MSNIQKQKDILIPCTIIKGQSLVQVDIHPKAPAYGKDEFKILIGLINSSNRQLSNIEIAMMKHCLEEDGVLAHKAIEAFWKCYRDPEVYRIDYKSLCKYLFPKKELEIYA